MLQCRYKSLHLQLLQRLCFTCPLKIELEHKILANQDPYQPSLRFCGREPHPDKGITHCASEELVRRLHCAECDQLGPSRGVYHELRHDTAFDTRRAEALRIDRRVRAWQQDGGT